jgi:hypothetical protein
MRCHIYIYIFVCPVVDTTLLHVCTLWSGIFLLTVHCMLLSPLGYIPEHRYHMKITFWCKLYFMFHWSLRDELTHFCWDWVGSMVDRGLDDKNYSEEVRKAWKEARCNGLRSVEVDLLRMIAGRGWRCWKLGYEDTSLQDDALSASPWKIRPEDGLPASYMNSSSIMQ